MDAKTLADHFLQELESEVRATRRCVEAIPEHLYNWKPHEKSMTMGYLVLLVAEIPRWIKDMIEKSEIDLATYGRFQLSNAAALVQHFDNNIEGAKSALKSLANETFNKSFALKSNGQTLYSSPMKDSISSTINHMVHHRGQLTVYMRLNNILVPSIYGPSADDKNFNT